MRARLRQPRTFAIAAWLIAFAMATNAMGFPTKRLMVLAWVALAVLALGVNRPKAAARSFVTLWLPLFGALAAYDLLRGASDGNQSRAHLWPHLDLDLWIGRGTTPGAWLQSHFWHPGAPSWWDYGAWATYQSHFFVPLLVAVVLWSIDHPRATPYVIGVAALSWLALATYALYPAQPPWMAARDHLTQPVDRIVHHMWGNVGVEHAKRVFTTERAHESRYSNPIAALPSLHAAFPMLIAAMLWSRRVWLDVVLVAYVLMMGLTLVYAGEHFIFDVLMGWAYALLVAGVVLHLYARRTPKIDGSSPHDELVGIGGNDAVADSPLTRSR